LKTNFNKCHKNQKKKENNLSQELKHKKNIKSNYNKLNHGKLSIIKKYNKVINFSLIKDNIFKVKLFIE